MMYGVGEIMSMSRLLVNGYLTCSIENMRLWVMMERASLIKSFPGVIEQPHQSPANFLFLNGMHFSFPHYKAT